MGADGRGSSRDVLFPNQKLVEGQGKLDWDRVESDPRVYLSKKWLQNRDDTDSIMQAAFDAFVAGGKEEAETLFGNKGKPVHCLSTRFEGVNYRASMLIGCASEYSNEYIAIYNPNFYNRFTLPESEGESLKAKHDRNNARWLLSFWKALMHTKRTKGCLVQVAAHLHTRTY